MILMSCFLIVVSLFSFFFGLILACTYIPLSTRLLFKNTFLLLTLKSFHLSILLRVVLGSYLGRYTI